MKIGDKIQVFISDEFGNMILFNCFVLSAEQVQVVDKEGKPFFIYTMKNPLKLL